jgi:hypothetical protein
MIADARSRYFRNLLKPASLRPKTHDLTICQAVKSIFLDLFTLMSAIAEWKKMLEPARASPI